MVPTSACGQMSKELSLAKAAALVMAQLPDTTGVQFGPMCRRTIPMVGQLRGWLVRWAIEGRRVEEKRLATEGRHDMMIEERSPISSHLLSTRLTGQGQGSQERCFALFYTFGKQHVDDEPVRPDLSTVSLPSPIPWTASPRRIISDS